MRTLTCCCAALAVALMHGCASNSHPGEPKSGAAVTSGPSDEIPLPEYRGPTELNLVPEVRDSCTPVGVGTTRVLLPADSADGAWNEPALEGLAFCLTTGPLAGYSVALVGMTDAPGRIPFPIEGSGRADRVRSLLGRLGVPFDRMITVPPAPQDALDRGSVWSYRVELAAADST